MRAGSVCTAAPVRVVTSPQVRVAAAGRRPVAGWTALAAGIAAIALMLPMAFPVRPVTHAPPPPPRLAQNQLAQNRISLARIVPVPILATKSPAARLAWTHSVLAPAPVNCDSGNAVPIVTEPVVEPAPVQIAVAVAGALPVLPSRLVYGPVDTEGAAIINWIIGGWRAGRHRAGPDGVMPLPTAILAWAIQAPLARTRVNRPRAHPRNRETRASSPLPDLRLAQEQAEQAAGDRRMVMIDQHDVRGKAATDVGHERFAGPMVGAVADKVFKHRRAGQVVGAARCCMVDRCGS